MSALSGIRRVRRVVCGVSGGVDSTVSAIMLKKKGYEVVGAFMRNWDLADETGKCNADNDAEEAERVCRRIGIPFKEVNLVKEYWNEVFTQLVADYQSGLTPNPDVLCNSRVKFSHFHQICTENIGCDAVATGHYARNSFGEDLEYAEQKQEARLLKAVDTVKDQTFFLSRISQNSLKRSMFPVGNLTKSVVKSLAKSEGFPDVAAKKESMGICFIGKRSFQQFISEYVDDAPGDIVDIDNDHHVLGKHAGLHHWTIGQRLPLLSRSVANQGYFVAGKDVASNRIYACEDTDHPALYCEYFHCSDPHWIRSRGPEQLRRARGRSLDCEFRFQNVQPLTNCVITVAMSAPVASAGGAANFESLDSQRLTVSSAEPKRAVTPGQVAAFYKGDECLGSAVIDRPGPTLLTMASGNKKLKKEDSRSRT